MAGAFPRPYIEYAEYKYQIASLYQLLIYLCKELHKPQLLRDVGPEALSRNALRSTANSNVSVLTQRRSRGWEW